MRYPGTAGGPGIMGPDEEARQLRKQQKEQEDYALKMSIGQSLLSTIPVVGGLLSGTAGGLGGAFGPEKKQPETPPPYAPNTPEGRRSYLSLEDLYAGYKAPSYNARR